MKILVTGGAGFIGSHLIDRLMKDGHRIICVDSFFSGKKENIAHHLADPKFQLVKHDIRKPLPWERGERLDRIYNLACPASPDQYQFDPVLTLETSVLGMQNVLRLARLTGARVLQASTSEVYGDPLEHPQTESYWGNVDPLGKRACYDEGKRAAEALCKDYRREHGVDARLVRIFNTYGPRMMFNDGRVLSNFILQSLLGEPITVHGEGGQTRSFCYVDDLVEGLIRRMELSGGDWLPVNLGNPDERSILAVAELVKERTKSGSPIIHLTEKEVPNRIGDPQQRCPDIARAKAILQWEPRVNFSAGLDRTIEDFRRRLNNRPRIVVFSPAYLPLKGPAEEAVSEIVARLPGWEFDVITARLDEKLPKETHDGRIHIYRLGTGRVTDKYLLPIKGALLARRLHQQFHYQVAWAVMASYGALAGVLFSRLVRGHVAILLSVYEGDITDKMMKRGRLISPLYRLIFRRAHRWQVIGAMSDVQQAWLENERQVQAIDFPPKDGSASGGDRNWDLLAKRTKEMIQELEILSTRL